MQTGGCTMSEERTRVLEMVITGKITVEQANQLLEVLDEEPLSEVERWSGQSQQQSGFRQEAIQELRESKEAQQPTQFTFDQIIELSEHEVDPDFLKALRDSGLTNLSVNQIIELS